MGNPPAAEIFVLGINLGTFVNNKNIFPATSPNVTTQELGKEFLHRAEAEEALSKADFLCQSYTKR